MEEAAVMMDVREAVATVVTEPAIAVTAEMRDARAMPSTATVPAATTDMAAEMSPSNVPAPAAATKVTTTATAAVAAADLNQVSRR
jgi:hypothetical protein